MAAPSAPLTPSTGPRSIHRQPTAISRNSSGPTWPSLIAYRNGQDSPARRTIHHFTVRPTGMRATPTPNATSRPAVHAHVATPGGEQPERQHERDEGRRVVEQPEAAGGFERGVVRGLARQRPRGGRVVREEVVAQRVVGDREREPYACGEDDDGEDGQQPRECRRELHAARRISRPADRPLPVRRGGRPGGSAGSGTGPRPRAPARRTPGCIREPRRSAQRMGTTAWV